MGLDNCILIKTIIILHVCQSWRPIQSKEDTSDEFYEILPFDEYSEVTEKDNLITGPPGVTPQSSTNIHSPRSRRKLQIRRQEGQKTSAQLDAEMDNLLKNQSKYSDAAYDKAAQDSANGWQRLWFGMEWLVGVRHIGEHDDVVRACYYIGTSYQNAITDIRYYFGMRYLYVNNLHYEVGFLTHEIVFKYQMLLEMFHIVQGRFHYNRTRYYAPTAYMLYMYSNILDMSKQIIHLCNMMHELEKKYARPPKTIFQDYHLAGGADKSKAVNDQNTNKMRKLDKLRQNQYKKRMRELKKQRMAMFKSGHLTTAARTRRRIRPNKYGFLHYGWSIEDWK